MPTFSKIELYLQPHVAKYLAANSVFSRPSQATKQLLPDHVIYYDSHNPFGKILINNLRLGGQEDLSGKRNWMDRNTLCEVWISDKYFDKGKFDSRYSCFRLSKRDCTTLNDLLYYNMLHQLYFKVENSHKNNTSRKQAILEFLEFYGITEEELQYESAKKAIYRLRKTHEERINTEFKKPTNLLSPKI